MITGKSWSASSPKRNESKRFVKRKLSLLPNWKNQLKKNLWIASLRYTNLSCVVLGSCMLMRACVNRVTMTRRKEASMFMRIRSRKLSSSSNVYQMTRKRTMMRTKMRRKKKRKMRKRKRKKKRKETTRLSLWKMSL